MQPSEETWQNLTNTDVFERMALPAPAWVVVSLLGRALERNYF